VTHTPHSLSWPESIAVRAAAPERGTPTAELSGFPVALKVWSADLPHQTEATGVVPGLGDVAVKALACTALTPREQARECELNPVIVHADGSGLTAANALLMMKEEA
jgi:hypothetical protein